MYKGLLHFSNSSAIKQFYMFHIIVFSGIWFVVDADLKHYSSMKMDSVGRNLFTILRHFNKIKEIRTKGTTRYAVVV